MKPFHGPAGGHRRGIQSDPRPSRRPFRHYRGTQPPSFAHPSEKHLARLLDDAGIQWQYEPRTFPLAVAADGRVTAAITPDFYLPELDVYVECTVMKQSLVSRKNRKLRRLREVHGVTVTVHYRRDLERFGWAFDEEAA